MLNATLVDRINITDQLAIFRVLPDDGISDFKPGQYVALGLPGSAERAPGYPPDPSDIKPDRLIKRAYSIGSPPTEKDYLEFYIAFVNEGSLTPRLALLQKGDRLFAQKKIVGTFVADDVPPDHNLILVSTGTGIAPYIAMVKTPDLWTPGRSMCVIHGVRYESDLAYKGELEQLAREKDAFSYVNTVSRAGDEWDGERGYVQRFFEEEIIPLNPEKDHVFVCGNPAMIDDVQRLLEGRGYTVHSRKEPGNLHLEKYW